MRVRSYELMFIVSPLHADDDSITNIISRVSQTIEAEGGQITSVNHNPPWGRRRFAIQFGRMPAVKQAAATSPKGSMC